MASHCGDLTFRLHLLYGSGDRHRRPGGICAAFSQQPSVWWAKCPHAVIDAEASHGLEQPLLHVLVDRLAKGATDDEPRDGPENQDIMVRFEQLIERGDSIDASMTQICTQLGVSEPRLRHLCAEHLGMSAEERELRVERLLPPIRGSGDPDRPDQRIVLAEPDEHAG